MTRIALAYLTALMVIGCFHATALRGKTLKPILHVTIDSADGSYSISASGLDSPILNAGVAVQLAGTGWIHSRAYPKHTVTESSVTDDLGTANQWIVNFSGLSSEPDISYCLHSYIDIPFVDIQVTVHNSTVNPIKIESIRSIEAMGPDILNLGGQAPEDRILSDSFSENRPAIRIRDLVDAENDMHRGVGSQLVYNRQSHIGFFAGALTSDRFVTVLRLHVVNKNKQNSIDAYEVDSTGTTELTQDYVLKNSGPEDRITLKLNVMPGDSIPSERLLIGVGTHYHRQLEAYGSLIKILHHAKVTAPTPMGWWSWTAYYFGLNEGTALTNAQWLEQHLKQLGYDYFHIDEGYQYARGEYSTSNATLFPHGMASLERKVRGLGLVPGIWTAPFDISGRSYVYQHHPEWLVRNAEGRPIHVGSLSQHKEYLFALDTTNPGAQEYLRQTYSTLANYWGIHYIKMDFMDDTAIEGNYYRPNTTAMEAQRIGLEIIRQAVGNKTLLDKDGSPMLNPVGYVDFGRISQDTRHTFTATKDAATGIAARYYMNRNFFVADPDAFTVSTQRVNDRPWPKCKQPLTLDEAKVSIALAAVSGGMFEIGDDLPTLSAEPKRQALIKNKDLIAMAQLGRASTPLDLMTYSPEDEQPSIFLLKENSRQSVLTIFNWTDEIKSHALTLYSLNLNGTDTYRITDILDGEVPSSLATFAISIAQPSHSVRMLKIVDVSAPTLAPRVMIRHLAAADAGEAIGFNAHALSAGDPVISYQWNCGDGVILNGAEVSHAYTRAGQYEVTLTAVGVDGFIRTKKFEVFIRGFINTLFKPEHNKRYKDAQ